MRTSRGQYKDYFQNASSYSITKYKGFCGSSGENLRVKEYYIDLSKKLPEEFERKFNPVNIFEMETSILEAIKNRIPREKTIERYNYISEKGEIGSERLCNKIMDG